MTEETKIKRALSNKTNAQEMFTVENRHRTKTLIKDEKNIEVDEGMVGLMLLLWNNGIKTYGCCEGFTDEEFEIHRDNYTRIKEKNEKINVSLGSRKEAYVEIGLDSVDKFFNKISEFSEVNEEGKVSECFEASTYFRRGKDKRILFRFSKTKISFLEMVFMR